nr:hypothetical protein [Tanacetum cinerariifolium]
DVFETAVDVVERTAQAVDREVAGEHRPVSAKHRDDLAHDPAVVLNAPASTGQTEAGDFHHHVGLFGQIRHRCMPPCQAFGAAIRRQPGVVKNQRRVREVPRQQPGFRQVPPGRLQVETQAQVVQGRGRRACAVRCVRWRTTLARRARQSHPDDRARPARRPRWERRNAWRSAR